MSRSSVLRNHNAILITSFTNAAGDFTDPTNFDLSIYPPGYDPSDDGVDESDAWVYGVTRNSGGSGPLADANNKIVKLSTGIFQYTISIPSTADFGIAYDRWQCKIDGETIDEIREFTIIEGSGVWTTQLRENNIVLITLDSTLAATDGSTLGEDTTIYFTTTYSPLYSSVARIRLDLGPLVANLYDDTINQAIFQASLACNAEMFATDIANATYYNFAKKEYSSCMAELILVRALLGDNTLTGSMSKTIGDLSVSRGSSPKLFEMADKLRNCVDSWRKVIRSGGAVAADGDIAPGVTVKGALAEDRITVSRTWEPMSSFGERIPAANSSKLYTSRKGKKKYTKRW